jgi:hypothetical protein
MKLIIIFLATLLGAQAHAEFFSADYCGINILEPVGSSTPDQVAEVCIGEANQPSYAAVRIKFGDGSQVLYEIDGKEPEQDRSFLSVNNPKRNPDKNYRLEVKIFRNEYLSIFGKVDRGPSFKVALTPVNSNAYWECQCFQSLTTDSSSGGINISSVYNLLEAEREAGIYCNSIRAPISRCLRFVRGDH